MPDDIFKNIANSILDEDLPAGHIKRFEHRLNSISKTRVHLKTIQRVAIAASIAAFFILSTMVTFNLDYLKTRKTALYKASLELYETELYLTGEIEEKMEFLATCDSFDKEVLNDIREIDKSFNEVRKELIKNPNDDRLISAVIETYRIKLDLLNEVVCRTMENKI